MRELMHIQQSDSAIMERISWLWVNTVSISTWPGSKHKWQAHRQCESAIAHCVLLGSKYKRQATTGVRVRTLDVFYWEHAL